MKRSNGNGVSSRGLRGQFSRHNTGSGVSSRIITLALGIAPALLKFEQVTWGLRGWKSSLPATKKMIVLMIDNRR